MIAVLLTIMRAAPEPCTRRERMSSAALCEMPQRAEPTVKMTKPRL